MGLQPLKTILYCRYLASDTLRHGDIHIVSLSSLRDRLVRENQGTLTAGGSLERRLHLQVTGVPVQRIVTAALNFMLIILLTPTFHIFSHQSGLVLHQSAAVLNDFELIVEHDLRTALAAIVFLQRFIAITGSFESRYAFFCHVIHTEVKIFLFEAGLLLIAEF